MVQFLITKKNIIHEGLNSERKIVIAAPIFGPRHL